MLPFSKIKEDLRQPPDSNQEFNSKEFQRLIIFIVLKKI
jgi:hypothetical protein